MLIGLLLAGPTPSLSEQVTLAMENAEIRELINWASDYLGKAIIIHPEVQGRVSVISGEPIGRDEVYQVFLSVLQVYGYALVEEENVLKIIPRDLAKQAGAPLTTEQDAVSIEDMVVRIIRLDNADAAQLTALLQPFVSRFGNLASYPRTNALIIADRADNITEMVKIIREFDLSVAFEIDMIELEFASITEVVEVLSKIMPAPSENQTFSFAADKRTNSILVTGSDIVRQRVRSLIERLDQPLPSGGSTRVVFVNYLKAEELAPILRGLHDGNAQPAPEQPFEQQAGVNIQVSEAVNALVITAPPELMQTMLGIIKALDLRRQQVFVEAVIVEVRGDLSSDLGIEWRSAAPGEDGAFSGFSALPSSLSGTVPTAAGSTLGSGLTLGFMRNNSLRALVRALQSDANANILSTPTIVTLDNEEAKILVGSNIPFITGSATGVASSTSNPFQTIQRQDIGITLNVKPRINQQQSIILEIEQTVESITTAAVATADIITNKRNIKTSVRLDSRQVLVLGGLMSDEITQNQTKVPLLGDIPVLGRLFRSTGVETKKTNLLVFIHPIILSEPEQIDRLSRGYYDRVRTLQRQFNQNKAESVFIRDGAPLLPELEDLPSERAMRPRAVAADDSAASRPAPDVADSVEADDSAASRPAPDVADSVEADDSAASQPASDVADSVAADDSAASRPAPDVADSVAIRDGAPLLPELEDLPSEGAMRPRAVAADDSAASRPAPDVADSVAADDSAASQPASDVADSVAADDSAASQPASDTADSVFIRDGAPLLPELEDLPSEGAMRPRAVAADDSAASRPAPDVADSAMSTTAQ